MENQAKKANGKILDLHDGSELGKAQLQVVELVDHDRNSHRSFLARISVEGSHPDLDSKIHVLELENGPTGKVYLSMAEPHDEEHTEFVLVFRDQVWKEHDWFNSL